MGFWRSVLCCTRTNVVNPTPVSPPLRGDAGVTTSGKIVRETSSSLLNEKLRGQKRRVLEKSEGFRKLALNTSFCYQHNQAPAESSLPNFLP